MNLKAIAAARQNDFPALPLKALEVLLRDMTTGRNNLLDEARFERRDVFNATNGKKWTATKGKSHFHGRAKRQDMAGLHKAHPAGNHLRGGGPLPCEPPRQRFGKNDRAEQRRIGLLDRKMRVVCENAANEAEYFHWAAVALKNCYGFELQGDTKLDTDLTPDRLQPNRKEVNQAAPERIKGYTKTAAVSVALLHTELAIRTIQNKDGSWNTQSFRDYDVHCVLQNSGIKKKTFNGEKLGNEWFCCDDVTAIKAITAVKHGEAAIDTLVPMEKFIPIQFRSEQKEAIEKTVKQFKKSPRMLWNAKMRFGKTLSALEVVRRMDFERTVLITHRPVVDDGWHEDRIWKRFSQRRCDMFARTQGTVVGNTVVLDDDQIAVCMATGAAGLGGENWSLSGGNISPINHQ